MDDDGHFERNFRILASIEVMHITGDEGEQHAKVILCNSNREEHNIFLLPIDLLSSSVIAGR